jgi:hypothetical protein
MNIIYTIARYEKLNSDTFLVAFNVKDADGDSFYIESPLLLSNISGKTTNEVCQLAYNNIKNKIDEIILKMQQQKASKIGYQFIPE